MKTNRTIKSVTRLAAAIALATMIQTPPAQAAGKPPPPHVELQMTGPIFTLPDHTADADSDQCREAGLDATGLSQRKTTMNLEALGLGTRRLVFILDFAAKSANAGTNKTVIFSTWTSKNCRLFVEGYISSGQWPLPAGSPGTALVVTIPAGAIWTYDPFGGAPASCNGGLIIDSAQPVVITIRRNDARTGDVCDCPFGYTDAEAAACP